MQRAMIQQVDELPAGSVRFRSQASGFWIFSTVLSLQLTLACGRCCCRRRASARPEHLLQRRCGCRNWRPVERRGLSDSMGRPRASGVGFRACGLRDARN